MGAIRNYILTQKSGSCQKIIFSPSFYRSSPFYKNIRYVSTPSKKHSVTLKALRLLKTALRASILILSTPYGLVTHTEAIKLKTGGLIMCVLS